MSKKWDKRNEDQNFKNAVQVDHSLKSVYSAQVTSVKSV